MKEYIEKDAARDLMEQALVDEWEIQYADDRLDEIPAADVVEVRHSHWVYDGYGEFHCHACKTIWHITEGTIDDLAFCPNCGAKMDGGADDE